MRLSEAPYPFYGRIFEILCRMKVAPMFKGDEADAARAAAHYLIILQQSLVAGGMISILEVGLGYRVSLNKLVVIGLGIALYVFNLAALSRRTPAKTALSLADVLYLSIFAGSAIAALRLITLRTS